MLSGANSQIITAFEVEGMTPEEISDAFEFDVVAVKATLMQFSTKYRKECKTEPNLDYTIDEQLAAKTTIIELMRNTDDEYLKARLALKVRDDGKGRLDINTMKGLNINVTQFNIQLQQARAMKDRAKIATPRPNDKPIEV